MQVKSTIVCIMIWLDLRHQAIIAYSQMCCPFCISFNHTRIAVLPVLFCGINYKLMKYKRATHLIIWSYLIIWFNLKTLSSHILFWKLFPLVVYKWVNVEFIQVDLGNAHFVSKQMFQCQLKHPEIFWTKNDPTL